MYTPPLEEFSLHSARTLPGFVGTLDLTARAALGLTLRYPF